MGVAAAAGRFCGAGPLHAVDAHFNSSALGSGPAAVAEEHANVSDTLVLGFETSCDETAAAVVRRDAKGHGTILSNVVRSQWENHAAYGGVVPEIAARAHLNCLDEITEQALATADVTFRDIDLVAATAGPGLVGGLLVGLTFAKAAAVAADKPFAAINHLEAHALTPGLTDGLAPPYLLLLISGGHTQILVVEDIGCYQRLGTTIDDALGEAFDKTAKLLDLGQPGGPAVENEARLGDPSIFAFPRPMSGRDNVDFSFAGLKTAVRRAAQISAPLSDQNVRDICAGFEAAVVDVIIDRCARAIATTDEAARGRTLVVAGGVAANQAIRNALRELADAHDLHLVVPPPALCGDNAAMVAWAAAVRWQAGRESGTALDQPARARWPLDATSVARVGSGRLGAKA